MVICLGRGADLHMAQMMPLPFTVSCFSKIQIGFTFLVWTHPGNPRQSPEGCKTDVCVSVCTCVYSNQLTESKSDIATKISLSVLMWHAKEMHFTKYNLRS